MSSNAASSRRSASSATTATAKRPAMAENAGGGGAKAAGQAAAQQQAKKRVALGNLTNVAAPGGRSGCGKIAVGAAGNAVRIRTLGNAGLGGFPLWNYYWCSVVWASGATRSLAGFKF
jgi:hypothetical protein